MEWGAVVKRGGPERSRGKSKKILPVGRNPHENSSVKKVSSK